MTELIGFKKIKPGTDEWNGLATQYSKTVIALWITTAIIFNVVIGHIWSLSTILMILPGIFVVSILSIPIFMLRVAKINTLQSPAFDYTRTSKKLLLMSAFTVTTVFEFVFPILLAILVAYLLRNI